MAADGIPPATGRKPIAFISHHSSQEQTARHLKTVLERNGIQGWMAPDDIEPGVAFDQAIVEQVRRSDLIVLLFCARSDQSRHVKRELMMAEDNDKLIYPVRLEDIDAKGLAYWLHDYQWIDWIDRRDATIQRMIDTIKRQVAAREAEAAPPPPDAAPPAPAVAAAGEPPVAPPAPPPPPAPAPAAEASAKGGPFGWGNAGWVAIGAVAVLAAILLGLLVNGTGAASELRPGRWETSVRATDLIEPQVDPQTEQTTLAQLGGAPTTECLSEETARAPDVALFDPRGEDNCTLHDLDMAGGDLAASLTCRPPDLAGGTSDITLEGEYDAERITAEGEFLIRDGAGQQIRFRAEIESRWLGPCG